MKKSICFKKIKKEFEEKTKKEMQKPTWFEINEKEFKELARDIDNKQGNGFKVITNK